MTQPSADYFSSSGPYNYDQPLPPLARTNAVTQVPPAKKITFYKSGDPQFGGVKMAINQRSFKSFNALMDDLSHRVPLPFGVRTITTPRGIHCISTLDQLEDGGCYLCSDKKYVTPISIGAANRRTGSQKTGQPVSTLRRAAQDGKHDDYSAGFIQQSPRIPKKVTLVKNGDITIQRPIVLNRRNARSLKTLLDEISEVMKFTVKKLFTLDGRKIDSMQAVLHCPNVLVCVGREPFKPMVKENPRKHSSEKLPGLASRSSSNNNGENQEMNFGLETKKSVMHPRSSLSNRSARFSLSSEKSSTNGLTTSSENGGPFPRNCPHSKAGELAHSLVNDDIEKKVHVNKDGSLSVEMKVRFRLLNDETLQWSTQIKKSSLMNKIPCEELSINHDNGLESTENPEVSSELDDSFYPCDADSYMSNLDESENDEARCHKCGKLCKDYDIWKNPMHTSQKEEQGVKSTWYTHSSCSSTSSHRRVIRKKVASVDSIHTSSSGEEYSKHVVRESSHYSETVENMVEYHSVKNCCCQHGCNQTNTNQRGSPEEMDAIANSAHSQNEEETSVEGGGDEGKDSRPGSSKSKSSQQSAESQIRVCEVTSSLARTFSSSSIKERGEVEDVASSSPTPNSVYSKSGKGSLLDGAKENADEVSENDQVISSFSTDSCPKKDAAEEEAEKEDEEINEIYSVSENPGSSPSVKDEVSDCGGCSTARSFGSDSCAGNNPRSDSDEIHLCSAASASSRKSKRSQNHLEVASNRSVGSSRGSTSSKTKKKKSKSSFPAEDASSSSRASYYSRSSYEAEKRDSKAHTSQDSSSPHSHMSSLSEGAAPPAYNEESTSSTSKCYSKSSQNSQRENQADNSSKISSLCSSFSDSNGKNGVGIPKVSSPEKSSRLGSMSESTCSKCGHVTKTCHDDLRSASSRVSSYSEGRSGYAETEASGRSDDACSQSSVALSSKPRRKKNSSLYGDMERASQVSASESASMYSLRCPAPPKGRPSSRKGRTMLLKKSSQGTSACTESEVISDKEEKEATASQSPETEVVHEPENTAEPLNTEKASCQEKIQEEAEGDDGVIPSSLPNASPEEVVHEWLRKIPSETLLMKCEMQDDRDGEDLDAEVPGCSSSQELLEIESERNKEDIKQGESTVKAVEAAAEGAEEEVVEEQPKEDLNAETASEAVLEEAEAGEAKCNHAVLSSQNNHKKDLPNTIQTSVQIMKALLASKQEPKMDRSHSLPEVSPTMGRKLSNSANILITCLASLQLLDEELDSSSKSNKCLNRPRYTELLNIFQALWCGCTSESGDPSSGVEKESQAKVPSAFKGHCSKDGDFTPMSSSGVDVSSGDGGSREGSVAGGRDRALSQEKTEEAKTIEEDAENTEVEADNEDNQGDASQPPTVHSKSEGGEKVESAGGEEAAEAEEDQGNDCETGQGVEKEIAEEEEVKEDSKQEDEDVECGETDATIQVEAQDDGIVKEIEDSPSQENDDRVTEEPSNLEATEEPSSHDATEEPSNLEATEEPSSHEATEEPSNLEATEEPSNLEGEEEPSNLEADEEPSNNETNEEASKLEATKEPSSHEVIEEPNHNDPCTKEANDTEEPETKGAKQLVAMSDADTQPSEAIVPHQPSVKVSPMIQQRSIDPDPVWVLKLLKKIELEFMTHYVSAMNEFKVKWNLPNTDEVNQMVSELKEEVRKRIKTSIEKELRKIKSRAGRRIPRPPDEELRRESTFQVENRRRRLQSIRKMSLYSGRSANQSNQQETREVSYEVDEDFIFSTIRDDDSELPSEEEYCPCDACIRKKMEARVIRGPVVPPVAANAPVVKAFDLQQILKMKKGSVPEKMAEQSIAEEGLDEEAGEETAEPEASQETEPDEGKEVGETNGKEEEQEMKEDEEEALPEGEEKWKKGL
ncbi:retinitis pigmentosa 1-like 1 protein [Sceloporus undulatus]|uniref:retinitis pigmentosa 1-like 1 protein n=1 Tax=Sceloporus undulatus TaxID=8520 RepID=UPI001C4B5D67|nr:retinitis pigmentosa 1-like 1 protein [Sceloporus undulatus]